jgi:TolA-binding protein
MRFKLASILVPALLSLGVTLAGCGPSTTQTETNDPSKTEGASKPKANDSGEDASLLAEVQQLKSLLQVIDKGDPERPKALDKLGEALNQLSKNHLAKAATLDPAAASLPTPPEPKAPDGDGSDAPPPPNAAKAADLPPHPADALKRLSADARTHVTVADKMAAEAARTFRRLLDDHPDYVKTDHVLFTLGNIYMSYGQAAAARPYYFKLIERYPKSPLVPEAYMAFAEHFFAEEDFENAYKLYQKVVEYPPGPLTSQSGYKLALSFHRLSRLDEALKALETAASAARIHGPQPTLDDIYRDAPKLLAARKPLPGNAAAQFFDRMAEGNDDVIKQELNRLAQILEDDGRALEAVDVLHALADRSPQEKCALAARAIEVATRSGNNAIRADEVQRSLKLGCNP